MDRRRCLTESACLSLERREGTGSVDSYWSQQRSHFAGIPVPQPTPFQHPLQAATGPEQAVTIDQKEHRGDFPLYFLSDPRNTKVSL